MAHLIKTEAEIANEIRCQAALCAVRPNWLPGHQAASARLFDGSLHGPAQQLSER